MSDRLITRETVSIDFDGDCLAGELAYAEEDRGAVLLIGPHPYMGGSMDNNVIRALAGSLAASGFVTLRFDYQPVAEEKVAAAMLSFWQSGHAPQDGRLIDEARAAEAWLGVQFRCTPSIVGYSFGSHAASEIMTTHTPAAVFIAPTVKQHELPALRTSTVPKLVLFSTDDFATSALATESWFAGLAKPKQKHCFVAADHFFRGREDELACRTLAFLETHQLHANPQPFHP